MSRSSKQPEGRGWRSASAISLALSCALSPAHSANVAAGDLITHVASGDTLIELAQRELAPPHDWRSLARLNRITKPTAIPVGQSILIPAAWRKPMAVKASVVSVEGPARLGQNDLKAGETLSETDVVQTGGNAVVVLRLPDGTLVRIPPASQVRIDRLRGYHGSEAINARLNLDRGNIELQSESSRLKRAAVIGRQIQVQTPKATASVRGTTFRIGATGVQSTAEVLDGAVQWGGSGEQKMLPGGSGAAVDALGRLGAVEKLLQGPAGLVSDQKVEEVTAELEFKPVPGAQGYLVEVARDHNFSRLISQVTQSGTKALIQSDQDGPLFLKVRPISIAGLSGFDAQFALTIAARPVYPSVSLSEPAGVNFTGTALLSWNVVKEAVHYRVQVAADPGFSRVLSDDMTTQPGTRFVLKAPVEDVTPMYWRVASLDQGKQGPWGGGKKIEFAPPMGAVGAKLDNESIQFDWAGKAGQRFEAQLSRDGRFEQLVKSATVDGVSWKVDSLASGPYQMRVRQVFSNGLKGPYSPVVQFELPTFLLDGSGRPVRGSTGDAIRSTR